MTASLRALEVKLAEAKAPSRELDELILHTCNVEHSCELHSLNLTDSLDKAVVFAEAMLPDRGLLIAKGRLHDEEPWWGAQICAINNPEIVFGVAESNYAALALCLATIRTLKETG